MNLKLITSLALFISSYSPLLLILVIRDIDFENNTLRHPVYDLVLIGLSILSLLILFLAMHFINRDNTNNLIKIVEVQNRTSDLINYTIPYILLFFDFDLSRVQDILSLSIFLLIMWVLTVRSNAVFLNPILAMVGYGLYDIKYEGKSRQQSAIVLSKLNLVAGEKYQMKALTKFMYILKN